ncbi:hypothetical protein [uncultured Chitinophaga sp.]|uniref:hypothetical protein n=1 Tax=uncultured Chitinophaga sp. TaxID=339340 RepID=UPI0025E5FB83|nr:hypothetical protein [uncultured Chitinophaga sp.]
MMPVLNKILILLLFAGPVFSQEERDTSRKGSPVFIEGHSSEETKADQMVDRYADSTNNIRNGSVPGFLFNPCFDAPFPRLIAFHSTDRRWDVIRKINNKRILQKLVKRDDKRMRLVCSERASRETDIYSKMSVYDMLLKRLKELEPL